LVKYTDGEKMYIIAPEGIKVGDKIISSRKNQIPFKTGNAMPLGKIPEGLLVHNIELKPEKGAQIARSAGSYARIMAIERGMVTLKLPSGELRMVSEQCIATIGTVGNKSHENISIGKAGRSRWLGRRPKVRGVAMNPVDHPHGGGEGKSSGGRHPVSPWGVPAKGYRTRKKNKVSDRYIIKRRK
jgi:large subunit ribosomal protein L2